MRHPFFATFALAVVLSCSSVAGAQDQRTYVGGAFALASWPGFESLGPQGPSLTFNNTTSDTDPTFFVVGEGGRFLTQHFGVGIEVASGSRRELNQTHGYFNPYIRVARVRDLTLFGTARYRTGIARIQFALVAGLGTVQQSSLQRTSEGTAAFTNTFGPFGPEQEFTEWTFGGMGGGDLVVQAGRHIDLVTHFRIVGVSRGQLGGSAFATFGLPTAIYRFGAGLRTTSRSA